MSPEKLIKYLIPFFAFAIISRSVEEISFFYYAVPVLCVAFIVYYFVDAKSQRSKIKGQKYKIKDHYPESSIRHPVSSILYLSFLIPGIWFLITALWSSYPEVSATRALYFVLISAGCISAGFLWAKYFQTRILDFLLPANIIVVLVCFFSLITNINSNSWSGGNGMGFMGIFGHQNLLASVILFTFPAVFYRLMVLAKSRIQYPESDSRRAGMTDTTNTSIRHPESSTLVLIAYSLSLTANFLLLLLTYSRASILSLLFGVMIYLILNKKWKIIFYALSVSALLAIAIYITPSLNNLTENIINKEYPELYSSRMWMWEPSYRAALDGGVIGLGYGISDPKEKVGGMGDHFEGDRFIREKGNSSLALIEETGMIGLMLFLIPIFYILLRVIPGKVSLLTTNYSLLTAALAAFLLHAQFEAWWVGVGSVQLPLFFIYTGLLTGYQQIKSQ